MPRTISAIEDITPDLHNANEGTERGIYMVEHSLSQYGAGRSILTDREGRVIAGNKTLQAAADLGIPVRVVETDGRELVVVQRTDLDLMSDDQRARLLAYADNRSTEVGIAWDAEEIALDLADGIDLSGLFREDELDEIQEMALLSAEIDAALGEEYDPEERNIGKNKLVVKPVIGLADVADFERAILMTGEQNRGEALMAICRAYLGDVDAEG